MKEALKEIEDIEAKILSTSRENKWSEHVPYEILELIIEKLFCADQNRFLAVCGRWQQLKDMNPLRPPVEQLPWQFKVQCHDEESVGSPKTWSFSLYDPLYKTTYPIQDTSLSLYLDHHCDREFARVHASKQGWLLLSFKLINACEIRVYLIFYNPFTKDQIKLPDWPFVSFDKVTCSCSPSSSDCTVFVIYKNWSPMSTTVIRSCHPGEKSWKQVDFTCPLDYLRGVIYLKGMLYLWDFTRAVAYDLSDNTWNLLVSFPVPYSNLVESGGELLLIALWFSDTMHVSRLVEGSWVRVESLGNRSLFFSLEYSISLDVSQISGGIERDMIYHAQDYSFMFYDLKCGKNDTSNQIYQPVNGFRKEKIKQKRKQYFLINAFVEH